MNQTTVVVQGFVTADGTLELIEKRSSLRAEYRY